MNIDIFKDNFLLLYMLFVVSVFSIEKFGEKQKIAIRCICTYIHIKGTEHTPL